MKIVEPETVTDSVLDATNVAETLAAYNPATSYSIGNQVRDDTTHHAYESLQNTNSGHALTDEAWWLDLGSTNPWAMFDDIIESQTENADSIEVTLVPATRANALAGFNIDANTVSITVTDAVDGLVYTREIDLTYTGNVADWYDYFFEPIIRNTSFFVDDLPPYVGPDIEIAIAKPGDTAKCGLLVVGSRRTLGATVYGADFGIIDHSRKRTDPDFGFTTIVPRSYQSTGNFRVIVDKVLVNEVKRILASRRATLSVFSGTDEYEACLFYGFPKDWRVVIEHLEQSALNIEIEGVI